MCWQGRVPRSRALILAVVARNPTINSFAGGGWTLEAGTKAMDWN